MIINDFRAIRPAGSTSADQRVHERAIDRQRETVVHQLLVMHSILELTGSDRPVRSEVISQPEILKHQLPGRAVKVGLQSIGQIFRERVSRRDDLQLTNLKSGLGIVRPVRLAMLAPARHVSSLEEQSR